MYDGGHCVGDFGRRAWGVGFGVGDAVAAAEVQLAEGNTMFVLHRGQKTKQSFGGDGEALGLENL